jgi:hypothetical protein
VELPSILDWKTDSNDIAKMMHDATTKQTDKVKELVTQLKPGDYTAWDLIILGWGSENMSAHYDGIKVDVAFRKEVAASCGVGFDVPASLGSFEPNAPKIEVAVSEEVAVKT